MIVLLTIEYYLKEPSVYRATSPLIRLYATQHLAIFYSSYSQIYVQTYRSDRQAGRQTYALYLNSNYQSSSIDILMCLLGGH